MTGGMPDLLVDDRRQRFAQLKLMVRDAWVVFGRLPDPDARFRVGLRGGWIFPVVRDAGESYGWNPPWLKSVASPRQITDMETVLEWMAWLRRQPQEGDQALKRIMLWAAGMPAGALAWREGCSRHTIRHRIDASLAKVMLKFLAVAVAVEPAAPDDEPRRVTSFTERPTIGATGSVLPGKVYIDRDGFGFMIHGVRYDPEGNALKRLPRGKRR